jgi:DNA excision repair protein ERCC-2
LHWAQARVYGHLLCQERGLERIKLALVYFQIGSAEETVLVEECSATELQAFFESQCARYLDWARSEAAHRQARDAAMAQLKFPMPAFRAGQRELAVAVYRTAHASAGGRCLMAQAPTGIGKTLATIFPMLKSMAAVMAKGASEADAAGLDKLFFLTAKGTGHGLALHALGQLQQALPEHRHRHAGIGIGCATACPGHAGARQDLRASRQGLPWRVLSVGAWLL